MLAQSQVTPLVVATTSNGGVGASSWTAADCDEFSPPIVAAAASALQSNRKTFDVADHHDVSNIKLRTRQESSGGAHRSSSPRSVHSSLVSPTEQWESFDEESDPDSSEEEESQPHLLDTEHQNLLDDDQVSADTASLVGEDEDLFSISDESRAYYTSCFRSLQAQTTGVIDLAGAIAGEHPKTMEFFSKSGLPRSELSKIWSLADVNTDGFLNLEEFFTAMHLIVLRRKVPSFAVPEFLPVHLIPRFTPPRNLVAGGGEPSIDGGGLSSAASPTSLIGAAYEPPFQQHSLETSTEKPTLTAGWTSFSSSTSDVPSPHLQFTNEIAFATSQIAHPIPVNPLKLNSPEQQHQKQPHLFDVATAQPFDHTAAVTKSRTASEPPDSIFHGGGVTKPVTTSEVRPRTKTADSATYHHQTTTAQTSAAAVSAVSKTSQTGFYKTPMTIQTAAAQQFVSPKPPPVLSPKEVAPPPPPPRPHQRHTRSASLDLTKKGQLSSATTAVTMQHQKQPPPAPPPRISPCTTNQIQEQSSVSNNNSVTPRPVPVQTTDGQTQTEDFADVGIDRKRHLSAPMLELLITDLQPAQPSTEAAQFAAAAAQEKKLDAKQRCELLREVNRELEKQLVALLQDRMYLEREMARLKQNNVNSGSSNAIAGASVVATKQGNL